MTDSLLRDICHTNTNGLYAPKARVPLSAGRVSPDTCVLPVGCWIFYLVFIQSSRRVPMGVRPRRSIQLGHGVCPFASGQSRPDPSLFSVLFVLYI